MSDKPISIVRLCTDSYYVRKGSLEDMLPDCLYKGSLGDCLEYLERLKLTKRVDKLENMLKKLVEGGEDE